MVGSMEGFIPDTLSCLLSVDPASGFWLGHSLDFGLITSGRTDEIAWKNLKEVIRVHVEHCSRNRPEVLKEHRASEGKWVLFQELKDRGLHFRSDKLRFHLVPKLEAESPVWMQGIELE